MISILRNFRRRLLSPTTATAGRPILAPNSPSTSRGSSGASARADSHFLRGEIPSDRGGKPWNCMTRVLN